MVSKEESQETETPSLDFVIIHCQRLGNAILFVRPSDGSFVCRWVWNYNFLTSTIGWINIVHVQIPMTLIKLMQVTLELLNYIARMME